MHLFTHDVLCPRSQQRSGDELKRFAMDASSRLLGLVRLYEQPDGSAPGFEDLSGNGITGSVVVSAQTPRAAAAAPAPAPVPAASPFAAAPAPTAPTPVAAAPSPAPSAAPRSGSGASRWLSHLTQLPEEYVVGPTTDPKALADGGFSDVVSDAARAESDRCVGWVGCGWLSLLATRSPRRVDVQAWA